MSDAAVPAFDEITTFTADDYLYVARDTIPPLDKKIPAQSLLGASKTVVDVTGTTLTITPDNDNNKLFDCYNAASQTLTIDTLDAANNGFEISITKFGAGDVTIEMPAGVTIVGLTEVTLKSVGYECRIRYNHARLAFTFLYAGAAS